MADDTDAVVSARIALLDYHRQRGLLFPGMDERNQELHGLIDAFAAAVRAESEAALMAEQQTAPPLKLNLYGRACYRAGQQSVERKPDSPN